MKGDPPEPSQQPRQPAWELLGGIFQVRVGFDGVPTAVVLAVTAGSRYAAVVTATPSSAEPTPTGGVTPLQFSSQVHPQKQSPHLQVEAYGPTDWATQAITLAESIFRHTSWATRRATLFAALKRTGTPHRRLESFANCGACSTCEQTSDDVRVRGSSCRHALCEPCRQERAAKIRASLHDLCVGRTVRFLTLTLKHNDTPLADQIDRLYRSFSVLRRRKSWLDNCDGGAAFLEVKISERDGRWHPHLHILLEGQWWDAKEISSEWHKVTGDSSIIDITRPRVIEDVCRYAVGYCTKTVDAGIWLIPDKLDECICALKGRRMCLTFGTWRGTPLEPDVPDTRVWVTLGSLETVLRRAADGVEACVDWLARAAARYKSIWQLELPRPTPVDVDPP